MKIIGVNGNPVDNGTVDKLVQCILDRFEGRETELINLRDLDIKPCKGCLACVKTNKCIQQDDWPLIENKIIEADIMVLGAPTFYGAAFGINALTHCFLERWFALRHRGIKTKIKKVIPAVVSGEGHGEIAVEKLKTFFGVYHNIEVSAGVVARGKTPCYKCGFGEECPISAVVYRHGEGVKITGDMVPPLEKQAEVLEQVRQLTVNL